MKFTDIIGMATAVIFLGFCLTVSIYCLNDSRNVVREMRYETGMEKSVLSRDDSSMSYAYLGRPGAYMTASQLALSVAYMGADTDISVNIFGDIYDPIDKREMSYETVSYSTAVYRRILDWYNAFIASPAYRSTAENGFAISGGDAIIPLPSEIGACKFKMQAIDREITAAEYTKMVEKDVKAALMTNTGDTITPYRYYVAEFRPFIFLGYFDKSGAIRYGWFECLAGGGVQMPESVGGSVWLK